MAVHALYTLAGDLLAAVEGYFAAEAPAVDLPDRRYVTTGSPAFDCEQVTVTIPQLFTGLPGSAYVGPLVPGVTSAVELQVSVIRCVPTMDDGGNPPDTTDLETSAQELLIDADLLRAAMFEAKKDGVFDTCNDVVIAETIAYGPEGGFGGWTQIVRVGL